MPDNLPPEFGLPLAVILWLVVLIQWRRAVVRDRRRR